MESEGEWAEVKAEWAELRAEWEENEAGLEIAWLFFPVLSHPNSMGKLIANPHTCYAE